MKNTRITESSSNYHHLEHMSTEEILTNINNEDKTVAFAVEKALPQIISLSNAVVEQMQNGGRLFYIGAGTSGRLGILDASECPPTFGVPHDWVNGIMAGGDSAIRKAVEFAEDSATQAWADLLAHDINTDDFVLGITASGTTPYVINGILACKEHGITTGGLSCNPSAELSALVDYAVEVIVGPEFVTGSTRMKSGTAQKLVLNMISTTAMIKLGRIKDNKMVDMQLSNNKLIDRGTRMILQHFPSISYQDAQELLLKYGSVRLAISNYSSSL
ncbi:MAG: N-acetylmuramic acid 6-phosphate etherase [Saprospiraceae bacterium]|nr:N-acetylmuramic acid 6-phosphate etherase [Saprospiraceae bacterium]